MPTYFTTLSRSLAITVVCLSASARAQQALPEPTPSDAVAGFEPIQEPPSYSGSDAPPIAVAQPVPDVVNPGSAPSAATPSTPARLFRGGGVALLGAIGSSQEIALGFQAGAALFSIGLSVRFDPAGLATASGRSLDMLGVQMSGSFAYMAYNRYPVAFGPEIAMASNIAPGSAFTGFTELRPGLALWYAPFQAPLLFGTAMQLKLTFQQGADPVLDTAYPGLRIRWGF